MRLDELKDKVDRSDYGVDPRLVAEALLRRFDARREASGPAPVTRPGARIRAAGGRPGLVP
jgi:hypothetical protein